MAVVNISLNMIAYGILEAYRANVSNTDDIDIRWIKFLVQNTRAELLKQKFEKPYHKVDEHYVQKIAPNGNAISMEIVDSSAYSTIASERYMIRTSISIPATIEKNNGLGCFTRIGPADKLAERYDIISYDNAMVYGNGKFNKNSIAAFVLDDRIYLVSKNNQMIKGVGYLDVRGVFQNPVEAAKITDPDYTDDYDYPINKNLADRIMLFILKEEFGVTNRPPIDTDPVNENIVNKVP